MSKDDNECPFSNGSFDEFKRSLSSATNIIEESHDMLTKLLDHTKHLEKLDDITGSIRDIKNGLLASATGRDQISAKIAVQITKILGWVILGLVFIIVFILTGQHFGWISQLK